jgi:hypothetical protein
MLYNNGGKVNVFQSVLSHSGNYGFNSVNATSTITDSQIFENIQGIDVNGGSITVSSSSIFNRATSTGYASSHAAYQSGAPTSTMENNFWGGWVPVDYQGLGMNAGPYHYLLNTSGTGSHPYGVSNYIDFNPYSTAYLFDPTADLITGSSPTAVKRSSGGYVLRVGSSTRYWVEIENAVIAWNAQTTGTITISYASGTAASASDLILDEYSQSCIDPGCTWAYWDASTTSTPVIYINTYAMNNCCTNSNERTMVLMHELGHAMGLAHSIQNNVMLSTSTGPTEQTSLGTQDMHDFNFRWRSWWAEFWRTILGT